jgi:NAD(P)-dependent dehydrogenase (short-subunit alcohol dehydrogenase family)
MFEGKVALVTGAAAGIGRATALLFAKAGARVACVDIAGERCEETVHFIRQSGGEGFAIAADLRDRAACQAITAQTVERYGALHHAFNNAGVRGQILDQWDEDGISNVIETNLKSVIWCMKAEVAHMLGHGGGTIVNTSSIAGISGAVGALDYTAAKHGVVGFSKAAAYRYGGQGVRINVVCPGLIDTDMTQQGQTNTPGAAKAMERLSPVLHKLGEPEDIAEAVLFLSSPKSKFIHGVALPVDGGYSIT